MTRRHSVFMKSTVHSTQSTGKVDGQTHVTHVRFFHLHMHVAKDVIFSFLKEIDEDTDNTKVHTTQSTCKVDGQTHVTHVHKFFWRRCI